MTAFIEPGAADYPACKCFRVLLLDTPACNLPLLLGLLLQVSAALVDAYLARRALDYMVGFNLSPLLWRRLGRTARSAGAAHATDLFDDHVTDSIHVMWLWFHMMLWRDWHCCEGGWGDITLSR
jgi:hypothetical protein